MKIFGMICPRDLNYADVNLIYEEFENIYLKVLDRHAPCKIKMMKRSRLRNKYLSFPSNKNNIAYKTQKEYLYESIEKI